jgi:hypothetical protein
MLETIAHSVKHDRDELLKPWFALSKSMDTIPKTGLAHSKPMTFRRQHLVRHAQQYALKKGRTHSERYDSL